MISNNFLLWLSAIILGFLIKYEGANIINLFPLEMIKVITDTVVVAISDIIPYTLSEIGDGGVISNLDNVLGDNGTSGSGDNGISGSGDNGTSGSGDNGTGDNGAVSNGEVDDASEERENPLGRS